MAVSGFVVDGGGNLGSLECVGEADPRLSICSRFDPRDGQSRSFDLAMIVAFGQGETVNSR
jgi:hypothetical protein